jgi:hypothetical protein
MLSTSRCACNISDHYVIRSAWSGRMDPELQPLQREGTCMIDDPCRVTMTGTSNNMHQSPRRTRLYLMQRMRSLSKSKNTSPKNTAEKRVISSLRRSICAGRILSQQRYITCSLRHIRGLSPGCVTQQLISRKLRHQNALGVMWGRHDNFILSAQHA